MQRNDIQLSVARIDEIIKELEDRIDSLKKQNKRLRTQRAKAHITIKGQNTSKSGIVINEGETLSINMGGDFVIALNELEFKEDEKEKEDNAQKVADILEPYTRHTSECTYDPSLSSTPVGEYCTCRLSDAVEQVNDILNVEVTDESFSEEF